jgi:RNA polymerase sigma factor (TIGR02999 family)
LNYVPTGAYTKRPTGLGLERSFGSEAEILRLNGGMRVSLGDDRTIELQRLIDGANQGDKEARRELIHRAYERLHRLAAVILRESFPRLRAAPGLLDSTDVANEIACRLYSALEEIKPATVKDFFRLAAQRIRWLLLDLARQAERSGPRERDNRRPVDTYNIAARSEPPARLADLYREIERLPIHEREVVDLLYFHGLNQTETATQMGVTERTVRRYWNFARARLFQALKQHSEAARISIEVDLVRHASGKELSHEPAHEIPL